MRCFSKRLVVFFWGVFMPIIVLCFWKLATDSASPYPIIGCLILAQLFFLFPTSMFGKFAMEDMALEMYHLPAFYKNWGKMTMAGVPWIKHLLREDVLKHNAEVRAAKLRAQSGFTSSAIKIRY